MATLISEDTTSVTLHTIDYVLRRHLTANATVHCSVLIAYLPWYRYGNAHCLLRLKWKSS